MVVAPALMAVPQALQRKSLSEREASSQENSTLLVREAARETELLIISMTCSGVLRSLYFMCRSLVARKV